MLTDYNKELFKEKYSSDKQGTLSDRYVVNPFSVLLTFNGRWVKRKRQWNALIQDRGESRKNTLGDMTYVSGGCMVKPGSRNNGVSLLDPVLSEAMVCWFCPEGGSTFDCFAGDSVFGCVSSTLGHKFTGIEIRQEQVDLNNERVKQIMNESNYICDDGQNVLKHIPEKSQDMLFSCPPYFDLEVYSDLENDASNQETYEDFLKILENAFTDATKCLKDDRFAVVVVGDVRDANGAYYGFPDDIKRIFKNAGMCLYNELVLVENFGTAGIRANNQMKSRKVVKQHQNVLVFYKGDISKIKDNFAPIDYSEDDINTMLDEQGGIEDDSTNME